jgi:putative ABC transport system permease protein
MLLWHRVKVLWRNLTRKHAVENDLDREIDSYREMLEDEKVQAGSAPAAAHREALMELDGAERIKEEVRDVRLGVTLESLLADLRQSMRGLRRNPSLTIMGGLMLALGMGAAIVMFSIFYAVLVQPLPFRDAGRLVQIWETRQQRGIDQASFGEANFWDVRSYNHSFEEVAAWHYNEANLTGSGPAEKVTAMLVTAGLFRTLGVSPVLGRDFSYEDDRNGLENRVTILGYRFWKNHFGGDPAVLGRTLRLDGRDCTVVGVLPPGEPWLDGQLYLPFGYRADANRGSWEFEVIGRLKPGATIESARADLGRFAPVLAQNWPVEDRGIGFRVESSNTWVAGDNTRRALWVLLGAVTFLLLIGCLNIANLLLARGTARQREIAVRTALGAARARVVRFVMMEALLLSSLGAILGLAVADLTLRSVRTLDIDGVPRLADAGLNPWVVAFAVLIAILTGVLSGLAPALQGPSGGLASALREGERQTGSRRQGRVRAILVAGEVALSFLLLAGAGLLLRSFTQLMSVDTGFQTTNRLVFSVNMPGSYGEHQVGKHFLDRFFERLAGTPGIVAAGAVYPRPVEGGNPGMGFDAAIPAAGAGQKAAPWAGWRVVTPGYFGAAGLTLLRGRLFREDDQPVWGQPGRPNPAPRVVISQRLAKLVFPNQDAVGSHVTLWKGQGNLDAEVVGVVSDSHERGPARDLALTVYLPYGANALPFDFVLQTRGNPLAMAPVVRSIVAGLDPDLPVSDVRSFEDVVHHSLAPQRFNAVLAAVFGCLALLLATSGIYGVLSYSISRRTSEIGLRVALGASRNNILRMAVAQGLRPVLAGIALGAIGAGWLSRFLVSLLFGVQPFDAFTYAAVAALVLLTALAACCVPGWRAMHTDPAVALRGE